MTQQEQQSMQQQPMQQSITYQQSTYRQPMPQQNAYQQPMPQQVQPPITKNYHASVSKEVGTGTYFGLMLVYAIPIVGWIVCLIMAFAPKNKNLKNYARATMIWMIIGLIFSIIVGVLVKTVIDKTVEAVQSFMEDSLVSYVFDGYDSGDGSSEEGDILDTLDGLMDMIEGSDTTDIEQYSDILQDFDADTLNELGDMLEGLGGTEEGVTLDDLTDLLESLE